MYYNSVLTKEFGFKQHNIRAEKRTYEGGVDRGLHSFLFLLLGALNEEEFTHFIELLLPLRLLPLKLLRSRFYRRNNNMYDDVISKYLIQILVK